MISRLNTNGISTKKEKKYNQSTSIAGGSGLLELPGIESITNYGLSPSSLFPQVREGLTVTGLGFLKDLWAEDFLSSSSSRRKIKGRGKYPKNRGRSLSLKGNNISSQIWMLRIGLMP